MTSTWAIGGVLGAAVLVAGCRRCGGSSGETAAGDATTGIADAAATARARAAGPWTVTFAARGLEALSLARMDDGGLLLHDGPYIYAIASDGKIAPLGAPADYLPFLPEGDEEIAGYAGRRGFWMLVSGSAARPIVRSVGPPDKLLAWSGRAWVVTNEQPPPRTFRHGPGQPGPRLADAGPANDALPGFEWTDRIEARDARGAPSGAIVWIGHPAPARADGGKETPERALASDVTALLDAPGSAPRLLRISDEDADVDGGSGATRPRRCAFLHAAVGVHLACITPLPDYEETWRFFTLRDGRWTSMPVDPHRGRVRARSWGGHAIDAEGALWFWENTDSLVRVTETGAEERFTLPDAPASLTAPSYLFGGLLPTGPEGDPSTRTWASTRILAARTPSEVGYVSEVIPRREGDVWVTGRTTSGGHHLYRFARADAAAAPAPPPIMIRSSVDEHNEIRNARGVRSAAASSCPSFFVPFRPETAPDGASLDFDAVYAAHKTKLVAVVGELARKKVFAEVQVVEGVLDAPGRRVAGVLLLRTYPDEHEAALDAAASRVAEILTSNPASPAVVICAAPTLDRIIDTLKPAPTYEAYSGMD